MNNVDLEENSARPIHRTQKKKLLSDVADSVAKMLIHTSMALSATVV